MPGIHAMSQRQSPSTKYHSPSDTARQRAVRHQRLIVVSFAIVCMLALVVFVVRSGSRTATPAVAAADPTNTELVDRGQQLYATRCAGCHGVNLQGEQGWPERRANGVMPASPLNEHGRVGQQNDGWIFTTIKQGGQATAPAGSTSFMPAFGSSLTDGEIWAVISYIQSTWPSEVRAAQPGG